jgi:hypothetical protein
MSEAMPKEPDEQKAGGRQGTPSKPAEGEAFRSLFCGYSDEDIPLGSYAQLLGIYGAAVAGLLLAAKDRLPERISAADVLLLSLATHKLTRLVAKDKVTAPLRAPFVRYCGTGSAPNEVEETPRGSGMRRALGELFT